VSVHIATETHDRLSERSLRICDMFILDPFKVRFWYSDFLGNTEPCNLDPWVVGRVVQIGLLLLLLLLLCTLMYSISALWSIPLALSEGFLYATHTTAFPLDSPDSQVICKNPPII